MPTFLAKTEPSEFSFDDLSRNGVSAWDGVTNAAALIHLRTMRVGDDVFIYHTGDEKAIVGLARVVKAAYEDPKQPGLNDRDEPKFAVVDLKAVAMVNQPVTLAAIKADARFKEFALVKQSRLSVMPVPTPMEKALRAMAGW